MRKILSFLLILALVCVFAYPAKAGINDRFSDIALGDSGDSRNVIIFPERAAPSGNPPTNYGWLYVKDSGGTSVLYFEGDDGVVHTLSPSATAYDDIGDPDGDGSIDFTTYTSTWTGAQVVDGYIFENTADFADISIMLVQQTGGNPTDGTVLEVISADAQCDALLVTASGVPIIQVLGTGALGITAAEFQIASGTGSVTIDDGGDAGSLTVEGTILDINDLTFVAAGEIITDDDDPLTLNAGGGDAAGEDLIITAHNIGLTAVGLMSFTPDAGLAVAIDLTDGNITAGISLAARTIIGTTAAIDFTDFDVSDDGLIIIAPDGGTGTGLDITPGAALDIGVDLSDAQIVAALDIGANTIISTGGVFATNAAGDITCNDVNATGTVTGATIAQNNIVPSGGDPTDLGLDGTATGGVDIGTASSGTITMGGGGFATLVNLPDTVDLTMAGGQFSITDDQNADTFTLVNNTLTTQELMNISSTSLTSGKGIELKLLGQDDGHALYIHNTDGTLNTGTYIYCFDNANDVFTVSKHGAVYIMGDATGTDALVMDDGDILVTAGNIDITTGIMTVGTGNVAIATDGNFTTAEGFITTDTNTETDLSSIKHTHNTDTAADAAIFTVEATDTNNAAEMYLQRLRYFADADPQHNFLVLEDNNGSDIFDIKAGGETIWNLDDFTILVNADTVIQTGTAGVIDLDIRSATAANVGILMDYEMDNGGSATQYGIQVDFQDDSAAADELWVAYDAPAPTGAGTAATTAFASESYDVAIDVDALLAQQVMTIDVENAYTAIGIDADLGPWIGTAGEGFLSLISDGGAAGSIAGYAIEINLGSTGADAAGISGKAIYIIDGAAASASYLVHIESGNNGALITTGDIDFTASWLRGASPLVFEGATEDANDLTLAVTDFESATTMTIPDPPANSDIPVVLVTDTTTYTESAVATEVITSSDITLPAGHEAAGQCYKWIVSGFKTGGNNTFAIRLDLDGNTAMTLTASSVVAGDFIAEFTCILVGATSQKIYGALYENGKSPVVDYATAVIDLSGAAVIGLDMTLANAGDEIKVETVHVTYNQ